MTALYILAGFLLGASTGLLLMFWRLPLPRSFWRRKWDLFCCKCDIHQWKTIRREEMMRVDQCMVCSLYHTTRMGVCPPKRI